jgi:hypothetical protein
MKTTKLKIDLDGSAITEFCEAFSNLDIDVSDLPFEVVELLRSILKRPGKFFRLNAVPTKGAGNLVARFEPTDLVLDLLSAIRAGDLEGFVVESGLHKEFSRHNGGGAAASERR